MPADPTHRTWAPLLALLCALPGCAGLDRAEATHFQALSPDRFEFRATTSRFLGPEPDGWAEARRLDWLETRLALGGQCPQGYVLVSRAFTPAFDSPHGRPVGDVVYTGRCATPVEILADQSG